MLNNCYAKNNSFHAQSYKEEIKAKYEQNDLKIYPSFENPNMVLRLELTNICNHTCVFCPNSKLLRARRKMDSKLAFRIIEEAGKLGIKKAGLFMNGEPFVSDDLAEYVSHAKSVGMDYVFITTNGSLATADSLKKVFHAGLDSIKFSINAATRETYKQVHGKDDFDKVMENLRFSYEYRKESGLKYRILTGFGITQLTKDDLELHYNNVKAFVDDLVFMGPDNYSGYMTNEVSDLRPQKFESELVPMLDSLKNKKLPCPMLFNSVNITCEGYLTLCCTEALNYLVIEDLAEMPLKDAWYSDAMATMRKRHIEGDICGTQCYNCIRNVDEDVLPLNQELYSRSLNINRQVD